MLFPEKKIHVFLSVLHTEANFTTRSFSGGNSQLVYKSVSLHFSFPSIEYAFPISGTH
jgi:hypothetical protein